jgi:hypothetical protein
LNGSWKLAVLSLGMGRADAQEHRKQQEDQAHYPRAPRATWRSLREIASAFAALQ